ncbi:YjbF family lipoprotein [Phaeovulum sp. W22_SRMD_FR3]
MTHPRPGTRALRWALAATLVLSACGNDTNKTENAQVAGGVIRDVVALVTPKKAPDETKAVAGDDEALAQAALRSLKTPAMIATIESTGSRSVLGMIGENGTMRTYATPTQQAMIFRQGILVGTRGLGHDMMSAEVDAVAQLIRERRAGTVPVTLRYLDGLGLERPLPVTCTVSTGAEQAFDFAGSHWQGQQVIQTCTDNGANFTNNYVVSASGDILLSRQWIGPNLGYVTLRVVRL